MWSLEAVVSARKKYHIYCMPCELLFIVSPNLKVVSSTLKFPLTFMLITVITIWTWLIPASALEGYFLYLKKTHHKTPKPIKFRMDL